MNYLKISRGILFLIPFTAVIVLPWTIFPFNVGKFVFFRALVDLSLIFFIWAWASGKIVIDHKSFIKPIAIGVAIFVAMFLLASFFAYDPLAAFWGNFERGESGVQLLHLLIFFFLMTTLFRNENDWQKMLKSILVSAFLSVLYGLFTGSVSGFIGYRFSLNDRFQGSLGNPGYMAQFMIFAVFFAIYLMLGSETKFKSYWYGFLSVFFSIFLLLSQTRGALLGFVAGISAFLIYLIIGIHKKNPKLISGLILLLLFASLILLINSRNLPFIKKTPVIGQIANISLEAGTTRIWTWGIAVKGIVDRPIFGWGPENFSVGFDKYFDTRYFIPSRENRFYDTLFDRAHSVIFDYGAEIGLLGLASYLGIFVLYYIQFYKFNKQQKIHNLRKNSSVTGYRPLFTEAIFFSMPVAYLIAGSTIFDVLPTYIMLFVFLSFANYKLINSDNQFNEYKN